MIWGLLGGVIICVMLLVAEILPPAKTEETREENERLLHLIGYRTLEKQAQQMGWKMKLRDYGCFLFIAIIMGYGVSVISGNYMYIFFAGLLGFCIPKYLLSHLQYRKRRDILLNLPANLRLWASQFADCKSVVKSLDRALPMMNGVTEPVFQRLLQALKIDTPLHIALRRMQTEIRFRKFDDFCDRLRMGEQQAFHRGTIESLREIIDDLTYDIRILNELDIQNKKKRFHVHVIVVIVWFMPFLFSYMESQIATSTLTEPLGKILLGTMAVTTMYTYFKRDQYLRLNVNEL